MNIPLIKNQRRYGFSPAITPGVTPVELHINAESPPPKITALGYGPEGMEEKITDNPSDFFEWSQSWPVWWVHVAGSGDEAFFRKLAETHTIHPLVLEDIINKGQRPKLEEYDDSLFLVLHIADYDDGFRSSQLSIFIRNHTVITFMDDNHDPFEHLRERIRKGKTRIRQLDADYLVYALMDSTIDHYFPVLETYGEQIEFLEDDVLEAPDGNIMPQIQKFRHDLLALRRIIWPVRDVINRTLTEQADFFRPATKVYLRDCYDHAVTAIDLVETYREVCSSLSDIYLSSLSNRMNEVMRILTLIATIFIPLTFIAGVYGMNFDSSRSPWNMPELKWYWGYPAVMLLMALVAVGMILLFKKKKWL